jgi:hypothetical protein
LNTTTKPQITAADYARYQLTDRAGKQAMAADLGYTYDGLRGTISKFHASLPDWARRELSGEPAIDSAIPPAIDVITVRPLELDLDRWVYASDFHAPHHNVEMVDRLARVIRKRAIGTLVIGGDLFDFARLSKHPQINAAPSTDDTITTAGDLLVYLAGLVDQIVIMPGNHCLRLAKAVSGIDFASLVWAGVRGRVAEQKLVITNYDYCYIGPEGPDGWVVGHPSYFSSFPAKGGADVADLKHRNVIGAHNHI